MTLDLLHRIRWANVARAAAVALALLLALAWPRLRAHQDAALPPAIEPAPAVAKATRVAKPARVEEAKAPRGAAGARRSPAVAVPRRPAAKRRVHKRHRHARRPRPRSPHIAVPAATPAPAPAPAYVTPSAVAAPSAEFRP